VWGLILRFQRIVAFGLLAAAFIGAGSAHALEAVSIRKGTAAVDLLPATERYQTDSDRVQLATAPGSDGIVRRIEVIASVVKGTSDWGVFALANNTDEQVDRLIVAPHYTMAGSGMFWPDLGAKRIVSVTPSQGFRPEKQASNDADIYLITIDPGTTVTLVMELTSNNLPQLYLWEPEAYKGKINSFTLYNGIVIGVSGLLALFLTILFVVKGSIMFPAAAALAWAVLGYIGIDFGFWNKVFALSPSAEHFWRASGEAILAATLIVFLFAYLNLGRWNVRYSHLAAGWLAFLALLIAVAFLDPGIAAGVARLSLLAVAFVGFGLVLYLATHGYDRAVLLIPTWFLLTIWVLAAGFAIAGVLTNDLIAPALLGGLELIVMLIGFTVMQHAFAGVGAEGIVNDVERRALALTGAGDIVWDWDVDRDLIYTSPEAEAHLGLKRGTLETSAADWLEFLHTSDRDRFRMALDSMLEQRRGRIAQEFRLRSESGAYLWFMLRARPVVGSDGEVLRVIGTLADVSETKIAQERLLHDAVHDNLTSLPNRELFLDRLESALRLAATDEQMRPTVIIIDLDRFKQVNASAGMAVGDSILLTIARRLGRLLKPQDTLARIAGDQFGMILLSERDPAHITAFADTIRRSLRAPIGFGARQVFLTASIGLVLADSQMSQRDDVVKNAELAMYHAKQQGADRIEVFRPAMRSQKIDTLTMESDLRRALERDEVTVYYQPIIRLENRTVAGFEALLRWNHPRLGRIGPAEFIPLAEETGLIVDLGHFVLERAAHQLAMWQRAMPNAAVPIFVSVNVSSRQLLRHDLIQDIKGVLSRNVLAPGTFKLEITESLVMENPELAAQMLARIRELGAGLSLDDFGTGYSSLAYLQRFPFDTIKIDQQFVRGTSRGGARPVILRSIIALAHDLGMEVVAEGAETDSDAVELFQLGCHFAQGYIFGEPMTSEQARQLVAPMQPMERRTISRAS
jgi:diguanylate cyclase (GGDEF)-like protein/PAS domain S-box-containing protein